MPISLKHIIYTLDYTEYFYEGEAQVVGGVITIPDGYPHWVTASYVNGFRLDPETGDPLDYTEVLQRIEGSQNAPQSPTGNEDGTSDDSNTITPETENENKESANEVPNSRGQSVRNNRVRTSTKTSSRSVSSRGVGTSSGNRTTVARSRNKPAN